MTTTTSTGFDRLCVWCGPACLGFFAIALVAAGFIPPWSPALGVDEVVARYREDATRIRVGMGFLLVGGMFYALFTAAISSQMRRIAGVSHSLVYGQLAAGSFACLTFLVPAIFFLVTAYRPERPAELTYLMNDLSWIAFIIPWPPFMAQYYSFAFAVLADRSVQPLFPRWLGFMNLWAPILFVCGLVVPFLKTGPFAWNGLFPFWVPGVVFGIWFIAMTKHLLRALRRPESELRTQSVLEATAT